MNFFILGSSCPEVIMKELKITFGQTHACGTQT